MGPQPRIRKISIDASSVLWAFVILSTPAYLLFHLQLPFNLQTSLSEMKIVMKTHQIWWIATKVGAYHEKMGKSKRSNIAADILVMIWVISFFCSSHLISHVHFTVLVWSKFNSRYFSFSLNSLVLEWIKFENLFWGKRREVLQYLVGLAVQWEPEWTSDQSFVAQHNKT